LAANRQPPCCRDVRAPDLSNDRGLRKRYEQSYEAYRDYFGRIARNDPLTRNLPPALQQELVRQVMCATAGAFLYKTTLPGLDAQVFGQDLRSMVGRIVRGAVEDGARAESTRKQLKVHDRKARRRT